MPQVVPNLEPKKIVPNEQFRQNKVMEMPSLVPCFELKGVPNGREPNIRHMTIPTENIPPVPPELIYPIFTPRLNSVKHVS